MNKRFLAPAVVLIILIVVVLYSYFLLQNNTAETQTVNVTKDPFLWRIEGDNPSYLYGSIHLGNQDILTLPDVVVDAIDDADTLYCEVELDSETQARSAELSLLTEGETLSDLLPQDIIDRLDLFLARFGIDYTVFFQYKIWAVASTLTLIDEFKNYWNMVLWMNIFGN